MALTQISQTRAQGSDAAGPTLVVAPDRGLTPRPRRSTDPEVVREMAAQLFSKRDPTLPPSLLPLTTRDIPHVYVPAVHRELEKRVFLAITNRENLFLQGADVGVGASIFIADYARAFNLRSKQRGQPHRIGHVSLVTGTSSPKRFLEALFDAVHASLVRSDYQLLTPRQLLTAIFAQARKERITTIVIDHLHNARGEALDALADVIMAADPQYSVDLEIESPPLDRIGLILVDHEPPTKIFRYHPNVLSLLLGNQVVLGRYRALEDVAEVLRGADLGLHDLDLEHDEDRLLAELVLEYSDGMIDVMAGLLRIMDLMARAFDGCRPNPSILEAALEVHRKLLNVQALRSRPGDDRFRRVVAGQRRRRKSNPNKAPEASAPKRRTSREGVIQRKERKRSVAEAELKDMQRQRKYGVLPPRPESLQ